MGETLKSGAEHAPRAELAADQIYRCLRDDIMSCRLPPGSEINAAGIAARYSVSKTPVRDGLRRLALEGLVRVMPRAGYRVTPVTAEAFTDTFDLYAAIGPFAAAQAARRASTEDAGQLVALFDVYTGCASARDRQASSRRLQRFVIACARNRRFEEVCGTALTEIERVQSLIAGPDLSNERADLDELTGAVRRHDPERARQAMERLVARTRSHLFQNLVQAGILTEADVAAQKSFRDHG